MGLIIWILMLINIVFATAAQLFFKFGMNAIGQFEFTGANFVPIILRVIVSPWILLGILSYIIGLGLWLMVLSRVEVGISYPITSLGYILSALAAYFLFGESLTMMRVVGILVIIFGVYLVSQS